MTTKASSLKRALCVSFSIFILTACTSMPVPQGNSYDEIIPEKWQAGNSYASITQDSWWKNYADPQLNIIIETALERNTQIGKSEAQVLQAYAQALLTRADRLPQLNASLNSSKQAQAIPGLQAEPFTASNHNLSLSANWELDLWGKIAKQNTAAKQDYLASIDTLHAVQQSIAAQTAKAYFAVIEARQQVELSQQTVGVLTETAREIGNRVDVGLISPNDKLLATANLQSAMAGLAQREEILARATRQLNFLLREYPNGEIESSSELPVISLAIQSGLPAELLHRRPDVLAAERRLFAAGLRNQAARRAFLPSISLSGSSGRVSDDLRNLLDGGSSVWSIAGNLVQPIFSNGRLRANIKLSNATQQIAAETYFETTLLAFTEVETALAVDESILLQESSLLLAAEAAEESLRVATNRYRQGIDPFLLVLESQGRALNARSSYISARRARIDNRVNLHLALGGSFTTASSNH